MAGEKFNVETLNAFLKAISAKDGVEISWFLSELDRLFGFERAQDDIDDFRLKRGPWKKLADEVVVVAHHFEFLQFPKGRVRFPLDNECPDCWFMLNCKKEWQGLEVTRASARHIYEETKMMIRDGYLSSRIPLPDNASSNEVTEYFDKTESCGLYSSIDCADSMMKGIQTCIRKKNNQTPPEYILLIDATLNLLRRESWGDMVCKLQESEVNAKLREIHVISYAGKNSIWGFQIK